MQTEIQAIKHSQMLKNMKIEGHCLIISVLFFCKCLIIEFRSNRLDEPKIFLFMKAKKIIEFTVFKIGSAPSFFCVLLNRELCFRIFNISDWEVIERDANK
jgi:hypothetical protein